MLYWAIPLLITVLIGYCVETIRMRMVLERVRRISRDIMEAIDKIIVDVEAIDIFLIDKIRSKIKTEYMKKGHIDDFRIYKNGTHRVRLAFRIQRAVQKIDIYVGRSYHYTEEIALEYIEGFQKEVL